MKKLWIVLVIAFGITLTGLEASAQPPHAKAWGKKNKNKNKEWKKGQYYYYPSANVYYSPASKRYWYPKNGTWMNIDVLPPSVVVYNQPRRVVYRDIDDDIWRDNKVHISRGTRRGKN